MTKKTLLKKQNKSKKHSRKHSRKHTTKKPGKHSYYIARCYNKEYELDYKYLEAHLKKLDVMPDNKSMNTIASMYKNIVSKNKMPLSSICTGTAKIKQPYFDKKTLKADVFFLNQIVYIPNKLVDYYPKYLVNKIDYSILDKFFNKFDVLSVITNTNSTLDKYCPLTFKINETDKYQFPKWYILRPLDSSSGIDIFYVNNKKDLDEKITYYNNTKNYKGIIYDNNVAVSEYITNPLLFNNRKFHLRLYLLVSISRIGTTLAYNSFLLHYGKILTAKEPFDMLEPFSKDKHDTHVKSTDNDYNFPKDFKNEYLNISINKEDKDILWNKISDICKAISKGIEKQKKNLIYSDIKNCYYIFGIDMMVRNNLDPAFIEINYSPGVGFKTETARDAFTKLYTDWIYETVLEPLFKYNNPMKARTHPTYLDI